MLRLRIATFSFILFVGCGGGVVIEEAGTGGAGASVSSSSAKSVTSASSGNLSSTSTGSFPCDSHEDCAPNFCIFETGACTNACEPNACDSCGPGRFCEPCGTSSCPGCDDCVAVCRSLGPGRCDDDDPCAPGSACLFQQGGVCYPVCTNGGCDDFSFCDGCATGSCCGCKDCVAVCLGGE